MVPDFASKSVYILYHPDHIPKAALDGRLNDLPIVEDIACHYIEDTVFLELDGFPSNHFEQFA